MKEMNGSLIGVDLGGTKVHVAEVREGTVTLSKKFQINAFGTADEVIEELVNAIKVIWSDNTIGIGIGIPSVLDTEKGIVYDVQNIPSWKEIHLKDILEKEFNVPVYLNNDANCFAIGEKYYGLGKEYKDMVGLIIGTGMAGGIIIDNKLYNGPNCGSGEFGMMPYKKHYYEYYCSGQYFVRKYDLKGEDLYAMADSGNVKAMRAFEKFGNHLGNAIKAILYAIDPQAIILGGSVSKSYRFYREAMKRSMSDLVYRNTLEKLKIAVSSDPDIPVLGAAALYFDNMNNS